MGVSVKPEKLDDAHLWVLRQLRKLAVAPSDNTRVKGPAPRLPQSVIKAITSAEQHGVIQQPRGDTRRLETGGGLGTDGYTLADLGSDFVNSRGTYAPDKPIGILADLSELPGAIRGAAAGAKLAAHGHPGLGLLAATAAAIPGVGGRVGRTAAREVEHAAERALLRGIPQEGERFAVLTAENAGGRAMNDAENKARNAALAKELASRGYDFEPGRGRYRDPETGEVLSENVFLVRDIPEREARLLGKRYGQNSIVTQSGFHDLKTGAVNPARSIGSTVDLPYTELPGGERFALDIDWDNPVQSQHATVPVRKRGNAEAQRVVDDYRAANPVDAPALPRVKSIPPEQGGLLADAYAALPENDHAARKAYDALNSEVAAQKKAIEDAGYKIEFTDTDPYKNSQELADDIAQNRRLKVLKTNDDSAHPFMSKVQNDWFRAVHDFFAHAAEGNQFGKVGEENAYRLHMSTLSPDAQRALATETRGQNSFVNFGPNAHLPAAERPFAPQKAALFPKSLLGDYDTFPNPAEHAAQQHAARVNALAGELDDLDPSQPQYWDVRRALDDAYAQGDNLWSAAPSLPRENALGGKLSADAFDEPLPPLLGPNAPAGPRLVSDAPATVAPAPVAAPPAMPAARAPSPIPAVTAPNVPARLTPVATQRAMEQELATGHYLDPALWSQFVGGR